MKHIINTEKAPSPVGPYNQSVKVNGFLFISGQIGLVPGDGQLEQTTIEAETRQVMENIRQILHEADMDFESVVKCTVFVRDMDLYSRINEVYAAYFDEKTAPARELVEVARLPKDANIEISVIATA